MPQPSDEITEPTPEEIEEILRLFGGIARPIVRTPEEAAYLEWHMAYVEREGHQPP